jgi:hypothetical protein
MGGGHEGDRLFVYTMERPNCTIAAGGLGKTATPAITYRLPAESRISWPPHREMRDIGFI